MWLGNRKNLKNNEIFSCYQNGTRDIRISRGLGSCWDCFLDEDTGVTRIFVEGLGY